MNTKRVFEVELIKQWSVEVLYVGLPSAVSNKEWQKLEQLNRKLPLEYCIWMDGPE